MRATLLVVAMAAAAIAVSAAPSAAGGCSPGPTTIGGKDAMVFCGPAKATVKVNGKTFTFTNGTCARTSKYFYLNMGTEIFGVAKQKQPYFGVLAGQYPGSNPGTKPSPKDGTYTGGLVVVRWQNKAYDLNGGADKSVKITLRKGRTAGTFTGTTFESPKVKVTGSFTC
jgi:hypothetical protein